MSPLAQILKPIKERLAKVAHTVWKDADDWFHDCRVGVTLTEAGEYDEEAADLIAHAPTDLTRLVTALEIADAALKELQQEAHDEHCDEDFHCNWCEQAMIARAQIASILGGE